MIKKVTCGLALMGCVLSSQAAVQGFDWSYSGFLPSYASDTNPAGYYGDFNPTAMYSGRFYAEDLDGDGSFSKAEVTSFSIRNESFIGCTGDTSCGLRNFSFTPGSGLAFEAFSDSVHGQWGDGWARIGRTFRTGDRFYTITETDWSPGASIYSDHFTAQTRFAISPVPEPQTWLMLGAGIALLGAAKRRRVRNA